jgi:hypothetical protein
MEERWRFEQIDSQQLSLNINLHTWISDLSLLPQVMKLQSCCRKLQWDLMYNIMNCVDRLGVWTDWECNQVHIGRRSEAVSVSGHDNWLSSSCRVCTYQVPVSSKHNTGVQVPTHWCARHWHWH